MNSFSKQDTTRIKGVAILFLMFHHLFCEASRFSDYSVSFSPFSKDSVVFISMLLKICVGMFAFITGYGLYLSIDKVKPVGRESMRWTFQRLLKTLSGFWFVYILVFIITFAIDRRPYNIFFADYGIRGLLYIPFDILGIGKLLGMPTTVATWWYMGAVTIYILLIPILYNIGKKVGYFSILAIVTLLPRLFKIDFPGGTNPYTFLPAVILGMMFADGRFFEWIDKKTTSLKGKVLWFFLLSAAIITIIELRVLVPVNKIWMTVYGILAVLVIIFIYLFIQRIPVLKDILMFLGKHSMTIFLTHTFLRSGYCRDLVYSRGHFLLIYLTLIAVSVAVAVVFDLLKKLCKWDRLINMISKKTDSVFDGGASQQLERNDHI